MRFQILFLLVFLPSLAVAESEGHFKINFESGAVWQNRNDVRIQPDSGTYVEFDKFNQGPFFHYRAELTYHWQKRHGIRLLYAPFSVSVNGDSQSPINFDGTIFPAGPTKVDYQFNSYRLSYRYGLFLGQSNELYIGFTGKIRDAKIEFTGGGNSESYTNTGFVPLLYVYYSTQLTNSWAFIFDMDAAAASQGRAIDLSIKASRKLNPNSQLGFGVRTLEGGADNEKVFTFSWFNYAVIDFSYSF